MPKINLRHFLYISTMKKKVIGLTGGIGSGKTTVAHYFEKMGIPVYNSDTRAKELTNTSSDIRTKICDLLGEQSYVNNQMNRSYIASQTFSNPTKLAALNAIIHPAVYADFEQWKNEQATDLVLKEAAILIETGGHLLCDILVVVLVDQEIRIQRTIERDQLTREQIIERINNQTSDDKRKEVANYIIDNNHDLNYLEQQVIKVIEQIKKLA